MTATHESTGGFMLGTEIEILMAERAKLLRVSEKPQSLRLEFSGGIFAEVSPQTLANRASEKEWLVEFPPEALRIL